MSALEQAYRAEMRWYPSRWRAENADALVALMTEVAEAEGRSTPTRADLRNLRLNGLRARFAVVERVLPSTARDRAAGIALGFGLGMALTVLVIQEWAPWARPMWETSSSPTVGPFHGWGGVLYSAWVIAAVLAIVRLTTVARVLLVLTIPFSVVLVAVGPFTDEWFRPTSTALAVLGGFAVVAALGRPITPAFNHLPVLAAFVVGCGTMLVPFATRFEFATLITPGMMWTYVLHGDGGSATVVAVAALLTGVALVVRDPRWVSSVVLLASPGLAVATVSLTATNPDLLVLIVGLVLAVGVVSTAIVLRAKGLRIAVVGRT